MQFGTIYCKGAVFIMTSNLGSEEIRIASPKLHKLVAMTEDRHEQYLKGIGQFNKELYPVLKQSLKRDEFLGRINQTVVFLPLNDKEVSNGPS
jgi:ATP-dependent Clp protease ATP-binding subunit ClpB